MRISDWSSDVCSSDLTILLLIDMPRTRRELGHKLFRDLSDGPCRVAVPSAITRFPLNAEEPREVIREHRFVELRERHRRSMEGTTVQASPLVVEHGLHLVADNDVRVQMRVARS